MVAGFPSPFHTAANLDDCEKDTRRYAIGPAGVPVPVAPDVVPVQAVPRAVLGDGLEASRTGKPGGPPTLSMDPPYLAQALNAVSPQGRGIIADATIARVKQQGISVKLAAKGYVNPRDVANRRGLNGTEVVSSDLRFIP